MAPSINTSATNPFVVSDTPPVRVAVVGAGYFGAHHVKHYANSPLAQLVAIVDPDPQTKQLAKQWGTAWLPHIDALPKHVEAVSIAVPSRGHAVLASQLMRRGLNVLLEKPFAHSLIDAEHLIDIAAQFKRVLHIGHLERFNPVVCYAAANIPGVIKHLEFQRTGADVSRVAGTSLILDLMIHDIDLALFFMQVVPQTVELLKPELIFAGHQQVVARLIFLNGITAKLTASRGSHPLCRHVHMVKDDAKYLMDLSARSIFRAEVAGSCVVLKKNMPGDALGNEIHAFLKAVQGQHHVGVTGLQARDALRIALKIMSLHQSETYSIS